MQRLSGKPVACKEGRSNKLASNTSKNKKQLKQSSSKNLKSIKIVSQKSQGEECRLKQGTSPQMTQRGKQMENDYGVNTYYAKYKVKTTRKKESEQTTEGADYGNFNSSKDTINTSGFDVKNEKGSKIKMEESDYASSAFQKLKIPNNRGVINDKGKFVSVNRDKEKTNQSFHHQSTTKHSFSLNFTSRDQSKRMKKGRKSKSKHKHDIEEQKSQEYRIKCKSSQKSHSKDQHHSYYEKSRQQTKPKKQKKIKPEPINQCIKIASINSKATSVGTDVQVYSALCLTQDNSFMNQVKEEIAQQIDSCKSCSKRSKVSEAISRERLRSLYMLSRICGVMGMKRESFNLAVHYLDRYCGQFGYQSMKLVALGALTLALKMDDAEMISKFCFQYIYNPERTVKKSGSNNNIRTKHKRESVVGIKDECREIKSKLSVILGVKISQQKRPVKQDFNLQQVLDFQTQIMLRFSFKLVTKTITYWLDMLTALWDSYIGQFCPKYTDTLIFRNQRAPRNFSYLLQLIQLQSILIGLQGHSKVALSLAGIYLIARMALQEKKEETPWEELCRYYKVSLSKTTNLIFCDGIGINILFGDFLTLFELSMANIIQCVQMFSRHLQPELIRVYDYRKVEGVNREDRIGIHLHSEELYRFAGL